MTAASPCCRGQHHGSRLHAWPLLGHHELAAVEVAARCRQQQHHLQRKHLIAVQVLVQAVEVARAVLQQQRRRPRLPCRVAARDELGVPVRKA